MRRAIFICGVVGGLSLACTSRIAVDNDAASADANDDAAPPDAYVDHDAGPHFMLGTTARPAPVVLPTSYDGTTRLPLIILLHAYGVGGAIEDRYLHLSQVASTRGAYVVVPNGTPDPRNGMIAWNDGIANTTGVDDVAYLTLLIDQAQTILPVDAHRIYFAGHSNGGFMAYRMACVAASRIAGVIVIAGGDYPDAAACVPTRPVSVLHVHGTSDTQVMYGGVTGLYSGAVESTQRWATRASCNLAMAQMLAAFDLDTAVPGRETLPTDYVTGCTSANVSLYTMTGSSDIPTFSLASTGRLVDWLLARSSP